MFAKNEIPFFKFIVNNFFKFLQEQLNFFKWQICHSKSNDIINNFNHNFWREKVDQKDTCVRHTSVFLVNLVNLWSLKIYWRNPPTLYERGFVKDIPRSYVTLKCLFHLFELHYFRLLSAIDLHMILCEFEIIMVVKSVVKRH